MRALAKILRAPGADPENSERGGRDPHPLPPPRMKISLFRTCSNKVTLMFQNQFENTRKKGGAAPSPKSAYEHKQASTHLIFASKSSKGQILRALSNWIEPFDTPTTDLAQPCLMPPLLLINYLLVSFPRVCIISYSQ